MSIAVTDQGQNWATNAGAGGMVAGNSFNPAAVGNLIVICATGYHALHDVGPITVSAGNSSQTGMTFTRAATTGNVVGTQGHFCTEIWVAYADAAYVSGFPGSPSVTFFDNCYAALTACAEVSGAKSSSPIGATGAATATGGATSASVSLSAAPATDSLVFGMCGADYQFNDQQIGVPTGFTSMEHKEIATGFSHFGQMLAAYKNGSASQTNAFTFASGQSEDLYAVMVEILAAPPLRVMPMRPPTDMAAVRRASVM